MKEYQKLLKIEDNRKNNLKAQKMVKLGLFEQSTVEEFDFENCENITYGRKFRNNYDLYETHEGKLIYIYEKNESDEDVKVASYAYDIIEIDDVTDEEYAEIQKAAVQEGKGILLIKIARIVLLVLLVFSFVFIVMNIINLAIARVELIVYFSDYILTSSMSFSGILAALYILTEISYRRFISE